MASCRPVTLLRVSDHGSPRSPEGPKGLGSDALGREIGPLYPMLARTRMGLQIPKPHPKPKTRVEMEWNPCRTPW